VVPGSNRQQRHESESRKVPHADQMLLQGGLWQGIELDGRVWQAAGEKNTDNRRTRESLREDLSGNLEMFPAI